MQTLQSIENLSDAFQRHLPPAAELPTVKFHGIAEVPNVREGIDWTLEVPEEGLAYDGLVLLLPGYGCVKRHSRGERHANAAAGEATISYNPARISGSSFENLAHSQTLHTKTADAVLTAVQKLFDEPTAVPGTELINPHRITLSPHSMGGFPAIELGLKRWAEIEAVICKATVGFGSPSWHGENRPRITRTAAEIIDYVLSGQVERTPKNIWRSAYYFGRSPSRSLGEGIACLTAKNIDDTLRLSDKGVALAYLAFSEDGLVPFAPIEHVVREMVDKVEIMQGFGHLAPQRHPTETATAVRGLRRTLRP